MNAKDPRPLDPSNVRRETAAPRKRFHIEKLEERIAPSKGGKGTNNCSGGGGDSGQSSGFSSGYSTIF